MRLRSWHSQSHRAATTVCARAIKALYNTTRKEQTRECRILVVFFCIFWNSEVYSLLSLFACFFGPGQERVPIIFIGPWPMRCEACVASDHSLLETTPLLAAGRGYAPLRRRALVVARWPGSSSTPSKIETSRRPDSALRAPRCRPAVALLPCHYAKPSHETVGDGGFEQRWHDLI